MKESKTFIFCILGLIVIIVLGVIIYNIIYEKDKNVEVNKITFE